MNGNQRRFETKEIQMRKSKILIVENKIFVSTQSKTILLKFQEKESWITIQF